MIGVKSITVAGSDWGWQPFDGLSINLSDLESLTRSMHGSENAWSTPVLTGADRYLRLDELAERATPLDMRVLTITNGEPKHEPGRGGTPPEPPSGLPLVMVCLRDVGAMPFSKRRAVRVDDAIETSLIYRPNERTQTGSAAVDERTASLLVQLARRRRSFWLAPWALSLAVLTAGLVGTVLAIATTGASWWLLCPLVLIAGVSAWGLMRFSVWAQAQLLLRTKGTQVRLVTYAQERSRREQLQRDLGVGAAGASLGAFLTALVALLT